jgi:ribosome-associated protein
MTNNTQQEKLTPTQTAHKVTDIIVDKKGRDVVVLDIGDTAGHLADYLVIATAGNRRQALAISEELDKAMKQAQVPKLSMTGRELGWWVLLDLGDVVVHIMQADARQHYDLEALWADSRVVRRVEGEDAPPEPTDEDSDVFDD